MNSGEVALHWSCRSDREIWQGDEHSQDEEEDRKITLRRRKVRCGEEGELNWFLIMSIACFGVSDVESSGSDRSDIFR